MINLYKKIKKLREEKKITQEELAKKIGISRSSYINFENGEKDLTLEQLEKVSNILGKSMSEDLLENKKEKKERYAQMLMFVLRNLKGDGKIPKTKLAKILYLIDFAWFYKTHESMSGMNYRKITYGPVPDDYFVLLEDLKETGKIKIEVTEKGAYLISKDVFEKKVTDNLVNKKQKDLMKDIIKKWENKSTEDIVKFTHNQNPYIFSDEQEIIPYELIIQEDPDHVY